MTVPRSNLMSKFSERRVDLGCECFGESAVSWWTFFYGLDGSAAIDVDDRDVEPNPLHLALVWFHFSTT
jgi:hypothetical protein